MLDRLVADAVGKLGAALDAASARADNSSEFLRASLSEFLRFGLENPDEYRLVFMRRAVRRKTGELVGPEPVQVGDALFNGLLRRFNSASLADNSAARRASARLRYRFGRR